MSYLLFLDESGHDHRAMPYEVRGGVALHASALWSFVQETQRLELAAFGTSLHQFRTKLKGCKLLDRDRFKWAAQDSPMSDEEKAEDRRFVRHRRWRQIKKGGNAVKATRKQPLGRASICNIDYRLPKVKVGACPGDTRGLSLLPGVPSAGIVAEFSSVLALGI